MSRSSRITVLLVTGLFLLSGAILGRDILCKDNPPSAADGREARAMGLVLDLSTNKQAYKLGETILVTATLRNNGRETVFLSPGLTTRLADPWTIGTVQLSVIDSEEKPMPRRILHSYVTRRKNVPLYQAILEARREFRPGDSCTIVRPLNEFGYKIDKVGMYQLRARYYEESFKDHSTSEEFEEAKKKITYPWWAEVESDWVEIEVRR